jgi:hypothetical protein
MAKKVELFRERGVVLGVPEDTEPHVELELHDNEEVLTMQFVPFQRHPAPEIVEGWVWDFRWTAVIRKAI